MVVKAETTLVYKGPEVKRATRHGLARGLTLAAERLRGHSVERAPIDLGDLRGTAEVIPASQENLEAVLVFPEPYAAVQHEDESLNHTAGAQGEPAGEARYVAKNYEDTGRRREYLEIVGKEVRDALPGS